MKRIICLLLALILMLPVLAAAEDEEELDIEETIDGESEEDAAETGEAVWDFPVALDDMNPDFAEQGWQRQDGRRPLGGRQPDEAAGGLLQGTRRNERRGPGGRVQSLPQERVPLLEDPEHDV